PVRRSYCLSLPSTAHHSFSFVFFNDTATTEIYTLSLHDALPISASETHARPRAPGAPAPERELGVLSVDVVRSMQMKRPGESQRSEEHTSELQSPYDLVCRLLLEKKKKKKNNKYN